MSTDEILKEIERLPIHKRMYLVEKILHKNRKNEDFNQMILAAEAMYSEYTENKELIAFTDIDFDEMKFSLK